MYKVKALINDKEIWGVSGDNLVLAPKSSEEELYITNALAEVPGVVIPGAITKRALCKPLGNDLLITISEPEFTPVRVVSGIANALPLYTSALHSSIMNKDVVLGFDSASREVLAVSVEAREELWRKPVDEMPNGRSYNTDEFYFYFYIRTPTF